MHSVDYAIVLSGEIVSCLDSGEEVTLKQGDILIQRGAFARPLPALTTRYAPRLGQSLQRDHAHGLRALCCQARPLVRWQAAAVIAGLGKSPRPTNGSPLSAACSLALYASVRLCPS